jgi:hypothetical protein
MAFVTSYAEELEKAAYANVGSLVYPTATPTIENLITAKAQEISNLENEITTRPTPKSAYIALLIQLNQEKDALVAQNNQIIADNLSARTQAEVDYFATIEFEKTKTTTKWIAMRAHRTNILYDWDWTNLENCQHGGQKKQEWKDYRQALRDIPQTYSADPDSIVWPTAPA